MWKPFYWLCNMQCYGIILQLLQSMRTYICMYVDTYMLAQLLVACDTVVFVYVLSVCVHNCVFVGLRLIC